LKRYRPFQTLFKSNKEELEILNSFQIFILINKVPPLRFVDQTFFMHSIFFSITCTSVKGGLW